MNCKICSGKTAFLRKMLVLNKYNASYFKCDTCGYIHTEDPYWLEEAYQEPINILDTGIVARNISLSKTIASIIYFLFNRNASFLDYAGGHGLLTRMMRDIGFYFYWHDPFTKNLFARGFESIDSVDFELITSIESFEHFVNPLLEIEKILGISKNILFTTELIPKLEVENWWYYGQYHGQHVSFYSMRTLTFIASIYGLNLNSDGKRVHLLTEKKINSKLFKLLSSRLNKLTFSYISRKMKSKTLDDHMALRRVSYEDIIRSSNIF